MPGTTFKVVANPLHHHGGLHIVHLKEILDDDDDDDEQQEARGLATSSASVTTSMAQKFGNISLGRKKNFQNSYRKHG
ncbi:unnamed protein product [Rotaria sordida]|uniref:Uncharacterized protein n=1 Tax=Rotaria sordida TaxID=392033 RepID=A0A815KYY9_9BILA|nr:unnamed protein product [Rotaria sordida]CAF4072465.1 unnamed protein product [Rotaria sordida]